MQDPAGLYTLAGDVEVPPGLVMVEALDGFVDAAGAARLARQHLLATLDAQLVASFDVDQLLDYRSRRPVMVFDRDHWDSYAEPRLDLHLLRDGRGAPFLLLAGSEPDLQWHRFTTAVTGLVEALGVRLTAGLTAVPMAVPHTRPIGMTVHATRRDLLDDSEPWFGRVQVPGSASALLERRLGEAGHDAMGFAVHVPQYLVQAELPDAAVALLEAVGAATGLVFPDGALREAGVRTRVQIDAQVERSEEVAAVVRGLEEQYDAFVRGRGTDLLADPDAELPSGDELGAELERFLAEHSRREDPPQG